jgi:undecaprenyl-diphosphatase
MDLFQAVILGIVQGLTEFLPVSSTAHLRIVPALLGWSDPGAAFTAVTQIGTMAAVLLYFRNDLLRLSRAFTRSALQLRPFESADARLAWFILLGTIPIGILGLLLKDHIETSFRSLHVIAASLIGLALLLYVAERIGRRTRSVEQIGWLDAMLIGFAQAVALVPGSSRSGTTITAGLFVNLTREAAARYSFLLSIPAVTLSGMYELYQMRDLLAGNLGTALVVATAVAGVVGYASIDFLLRFLRTHSTYLFIAYRVSLGLLIFLLLALNILQP